VVFFNFNYKLENKKLISSIITSDDERIMTISGTYAENGQIGASGTYFIRYDYIKKEVIDNGLNKFDSDFITKDWSEKLKKKEEKAKGSEATLENYELRNIEVLKDGSIIKTMEQYYFTSYTYQSYNGQSGTTYTHYINDIIAYKISALGKLDWLVRIDKNQIDLYYS